MTVEWGELPPDGRGFRERWTDEAVRQLRERPNCWAKIRTSGNAGTARSVASRMNARYPRVEVTVRGLDIWARYVEDGAAK